MTTADASVTDTVEVPGTSLRLPPISVGAMFWGYDLDDAAAHALLDHALDRGARFIDTANNYAVWRDGGTGDESESSLGRWFAARGPGGRDRVLLATKLGARPTAGRDMSHRLGLGKGVIRSQLVDSLRRLQTDHVDLLYAHVDDHDVPFAETLGAMQELVDEGLVRVLGASNLTAARVREAAGSVPDFGATGYRVLQNRFTYLPVRPDADTGLQVEFGADVSEAATAADMIGYGYSPLLSGAYTRTERPVPDSNRDERLPHRLATLRSAADRVGLDAGQTVLAWMGQRPQRVLPLIGVSRPDQLDSALQAVTTALPDDVIADLDRARG